MFKVLRKVHTPEATEEMIAAVEESTQEQQITVELSQPVVEEKKQSLVQHVEEEHAPENCCRTVCHP